MAPLFLSQAPDRLHFSMGTSHGGCPKDAGQWDTDPILSLTLYLRIPRAASVRVRGHRPGSRGKPEVAALSVCDAVESWSGGGRHCSGGAGVLTKTTAVGLGQGSSRRFPSTFPARKTRPETKLESLPLSQVCKFSQQGVPAQPPPHPWHICSHQQPHEASLRDSPAFPVRK